MSYPAPPSLILTLAPKLLHFLMLRPFLFSQVDRVKLKSFFNKFQTFSSYSFQSFFSGMYFTKVLLVSHTGKRDRNICLFKNYNFTGCPKRFWMHTPSIITHIDLATLGEMHRTFNLV